MCSILNHFILLEALVLASALSLDALVASFAYGSSRIRLPFSSVATISLVCSAILGVSLLAGAALRPFLPHGAAKALCFGILFLLGLVKLFDGITKAVIRKHTSLNKQISFSMFSLRCVLTLYADPEQADRDRSKTLSPKEAVSLAVALSLDGAAVGFGAAMGHASPGAVVLCSLAANAAALGLGAWLGRRLARCLPWDLSWVSGGVLILLGILKLF